MTLLKIFLGQVPEAIFFSLFMIYTKRLKSYKNIIFTILMILEYVLLANTLGFNVWYHIIYTFTTFCLLRLLYKEKAQITDIFTFGIASLFLILSSFICFLIFGSNMVALSIANRILIFTLLFVFKDKLYNIQKLYKKLWNRNDKVEKKMKSTTFRALNIVIFNFMFYFINLGMAYAIYYNFKK